MDAFAAYGHALASVALFALIVMVLSPLSAIPKEKKGLAPGGTPVEDYADPAYRLHRAYHNGADTIGIFAAVVMVAALAGANPFWVNLLASVVFASRALMVALHVSGIGKPHSGARSIAYVVGLLSMMAMAVLGLVAVF